MNKHLSILIVTWNSWNDLERCINSILKTNNLDDFEIIVIDNGSEDDTVKNVQQLYGDKVQLHCNETNLGLPAAVNEGMQHVQGDYVMLLDVDTEVQSNTVPILLRFMHEHPEVALIAPRVLTPEGQSEGTARNLPSAMNGLFGRQSALTRLFPNNRFSKRYMIRRQQDDETPFQVEQVSAACMFFRSEFLDEVGLWDEAYRCYWVDTDWCARLKKLNKIVYCVPKAHITHYENNRAGKKKSVWRIWHFHTGAFRLYRKHYTMGWVDPRTILAGALLMTRAGIILLINHFQSTKDDEPSDKQTQSV
jgi:GT2 family glycosyltransferase